MILFLLLFTAIGTCFADPTQVEDDFWADSIVLKTKMLQFDDFPDAHNPSLLKLEEGYLFSFRYQPDRWGEYWISQIGVVMLDDQFEPIGEPQLLDTRLVDNFIPSQSEDARLFTYKEKTYLIYNDGVENVNPTTSQRRDMYLAELCCEKGEFFLSTPLKLFYEAKRSIPWQKNWVPFEWNGMLLLSYSMVPQEILFPNLKNGECYFGYKSHASVDWPLGVLRGSTHAVLDEGEYLAFFHSGMITSSTASAGWNLWHYFMGAYTFSAEPPFEITKLSAKPIIGEGFYTYSSFLKRVIFPSGFVIDGPYIHVAYGKDDSEMWIATLDKEALKTSLVPVTSE